MIDLENTLGFLITETSYLMRKHLINGLREQGHDYGLSIEELPLLGRVYQYPGISQAGLNGLTRKDKTTVARLLAAMEKKDLIQREVNPDDRRARYVSLGKNGLCLVEQLLPLVYQFRKQTTQGISEEDLAVTMRTMKVLYQRLLEL